MKEVKIEQEVLGEVVKWKAPEIHSHLESLGLSWLLVGMKWFICLFADVLPIDTVLRIWDCLFYEGEKVLIRASLALILLNKEKILACRDFGQVTNVFKNIITDSTALHCHEFLKWSPDKLRRPLPPCTFHFLDFSNDIFTVTGSNAVWSMVKSADDNTSMFDDVGSLPKSRIHKLRKTCEDKI